MTKSNSPGSFQQLEMKDNLLDNSKDQDTGNDTTNETERNDCFPNLELKHRVIIFVVLNIIGYAMQIGGITKLIEAFYSNEYKYFAIIYTLGEISYINNS